MGGKSGGASGGPTTVTQVSQPPAEFLEAYKYVLDLAKKQQQQPLVQYEGEMVAPFQPAQQQAFDIVGNQAQALQGIPGMAQPYIDAAVGAFGQSVTPLWENVQQFSPEAVGRYMSPYTQSVIDATQAQFNQANAMQDQALIGNAIASGAWGGDRAGIARGVLAGQQQMAQAPIIAGLYERGYGNALDMFRQQQAAELGADTTQAGLWGQAAFGLGNLGAEAQNLQVGGINAALGGANALLGTGQLQQAQRQAELNIPYQQFVQEQAFPWQSIGWLGGIAQGLGSAAGGTASTIYPEPSTASQVLGGATGLAGLLGMTGAFGSGGWFPKIFSFARGGKVPRRAYGGLVPERDDDDEYEDVTPGGVVPFHARGIPDPSRPFIPSIALGRGAGPPKPVLDQNMMPTTLADIGTQALARARPFFVDEENGEFDENAWTDADADDLDWMQSRYRSGGMVGYQDGGAADDEDEDEYPAFGGLAPEESGAAAAFGIAPDEMLGADEGETPAVGGVVPYGYQYEPPARSDRAKAARDRAMWAGLATAGLGIMAGKSPYAAQNIGQGAARGVDVWEKGMAGADVLEAREEERVDTGRYRKANLDVQAQRFADAAEAARRRIAATTAHQARTAEEQARHNRATEETAASRAKTAQELAAHGRYQYIGRTDDNRPMYFDSRTAKTVIGDTPLEKPGKGAGAREGVTQALVRQLIQDGAAKDTLEALAILKDPSGANTLKLRQAQERLALQAVANDVKSVGDPTGRLNYWRNFFSLQGPPVAPGAAPAARPAPAPAAPAAAGAARLGSRENPHRPRTREEAMAVPSGEWMVNPANGQVGRKR